MAPQSDIEKAARGDRARIEELVARQEASVRRAFRRFLDETRSDAVVRQVRIALEQQGTEAALRVVDAHVVRLGTVVAQVFQASGASEATALASQLRTRHAHVAISFDPTWPRAAQLMRQNTLRFVVEFSSAQREATRAALAEALASGAGPLQAGQAFRDSIGLTETQRQAVANYRRLLEAGDAAALQRDLRDRRFLPEGSASREAFLAGEPLGARRIARMVEQYRNRYLAYRAETIARTETLRVANEARSEALTQVLGQVDLPADAVTRTWRATRDDRTRDTHAAMDGQVQQGSAPFVSPSGARLMFPGDVSLGAPASEIVNCLLGYATIEAPGLTAIARGWYDGQAVTVVLASGRELPVTAHHPVMTDTGWCPAAQLQEGDKLVSCGSSNSASISRGDAEYVPPTVEQLYESPTLIPVVRQRLRMNFHGDIVDSNIDIKVQVGYLPVIFQTQLAKHAAEGIFPASCMGPAFATRNCSHLFGAQRILLATSSSLSGRNLLVSAFLRNLRPLDELSLRLRSWPHSQSLERVFRSCSAYAVELAQLRARYPGLVEFDEVVGVRRYKFVGHVYSPQTVSNTYLGGNILNHNCRCVVLNSVPTT
jgi:Phage Mu protein F like protein